MKIPEDIPPEDKDAYVIEQRIKRRTFRRIARETGLSIDECERIWKDHVALSIVKNVKDVNEWRITQLEQLDQHYSLLEDFLELPEVTDDTARRVAIVRVQTDSLQARYAKLLGLDAPTKIETPPEGIKLRINDIDCTEQGG